MNAREAIYELSKTRDMRLTVREGIQRLIREQQEKIDNMVPMSKADVIQSAVWLVRDVWDHGREDTEFNRGYRKALADLESMTKHMKE